MLILSSKEIQIYTGINVRNFNYLLSYLYSMNINKSNYKIKLSNRLFITLIYLKTNRTMKELSFLFDISESTVSRIIKQITIYVSKMYICSDNDTYSSNNTLLLDSTLIPSWDKSISNRSRNTKNSSNI
jgi:hypothetical protein